MLAEGKGSKLIAKLTKVETIPRRSQTTAIRGPPFDRLRRTLARGTRHGDRVQWAELR